MIHSLVRTTGIPLLQDLFLGKNFFLPIPPTREEGKGRDEGWGSESEPFSCLFFPSLFVQPRHLKCCCE